MNGDARIFWRSTRLPLLVTAAAALTGCASLSGIEPGGGASIDPRSPAAAQIEAAARQAGPTPSLAEVPPPPTDLRPAEAWRAAIADQQAEGAYVLNSAAPSTWTLSDTDGFVAGARAQVDVAGLHAPTDAEIAESEAFAKAMRQRATPPPSPR